VFIDDFTTYAFTFAMSSKGQVHECFVRFAGIVENKFGTKIATV
jgi:hypothetical protein